LPAPVYRIAHFCYFQRRLPCLVRPVTFNDKLCRAMIFDRDPQRVRFADKFQVRAFVSERLGGAAHLVRLHAHFDVAADIRAIDLPRRFVLKANHGSGWAHLHDGAAAPDVDALERLSRTWLANSYFARSKEWCYRDIKPRILVEEFLGPGPQPPEDYKFFCFSGRVEMIQVDLDRYVDHRRNLYDRDWNLLPLEYAYPCDPGRCRARPERLDLMIAIAERLSAGVAFVRVDLYCVDGDVRFGEMTNYPEGAGKRFTPRDWDRALGAMWR
jgi:hypothetical protein